MNATIKTAIGPTILLGSGTYFDYLDPENSEITIEDYAAGLAFECRFSGQCVDQRTKKRVYYSVAQHAVIGSYLVPPEYAYDFLMHESGEPVCGDMVSPLKTLLPEYRGIEKRCEAAIMTKFGVTMSNPEVVKEFDLRMWATEREQLMEWDGQPWGGDGFGDPNGGILPLRITIIPVGPEAAYDMFLARFNELKPAGIAAAKSLTPAPQDHVVVLEEIKYLALTAGAPGHMPVPKALSCMIGLCNRAGVTKKLDDLRPLFAAAPEGSI